MERYEVKEVESGKIIGTVKGRNIIKTVNRRGHETQIEGEVITVLSAISGEALYQLIETKELKKVTLIGLDIEVEFDDEVYCWIEEGTTLEGRLTTDGRVIIWDDAHNGWLQVWRV